jgi:hypothetical protein
MRSDEDRPNYYRDRQGERAPVESTAILSSSWYRIEVRICDVSQCGFQAECREPVRIGSFVSLDVPGIGEVDAQVRWQIGHRMGGMFSDPISLTRCEWTAVRTSAPQHRPT